METKTSQNREVIEHYYRSLASGDSETFASLHDESVVYHLVGKTPVSGRFEGRELFLSQVASPVLHALVPGRFRFARRWRIMCADENCVTALMQGGGPAKTGLAYEQTYCQVFTLRGGKICEVHEFFDTVLAEEALFGNRLQEPEREPARPMEF